MIACSSPYSLKDRVLVFGTSDGGSIPPRGTTYVRQSRTTWLERVRKQRITFHQIRHETFGFEPLETGKDKCRT